MNRFYLNLISAALLTMTAHLSYGHGGRASLSDSIPDQCQGDSLPRPMLSIDSTTADFGTIRRGDTCQHSFSITNTGSAPLVIYNAYAGCRCTSIDYSASPVMPGETVAVKVTFDSHGRPLGYFTKLVRMRTNATSQPVRLYIKGRISG